MNYLVTFIVKIKLFYFPNDSLHFEPLWPFEGYCELNTFKTRKPCFAWFAFTHFNKINAKKSFELGNWANLSACWGTTLYAKLCDTKVGREYNQNIPNMRRKI